MNGERERRRLGGGHWTQDWRTIQLLSVSGGGNHFAGEWKGLNRREEHINFGL